MRKYKGPNRTKKDPDPAIIPSARALQLPDEVEIGMKRWWGTEQRLREALKHIANRGTPTDNAITWVKEVFINEFIPDYFQDMCLSDNDARWYHQVIGSKIYGFVYRAATTLDKHGTLPTFRVINLPRSRQYAYGHDYWRRANLAVFDELVADWVKTHPPPANIGEAMSLSRKLFSRQPKEVQKKFEDIAAEDLAASQALEVLVVSEARDKYLKRFIHDVKSLIHQGEMKCGIQVCVQLLMPLNGNQFKLKSLVSPPLSEFAKAGPIEDLLRSLQEHVEQAGANHVIEGPPRIRIMCNFSNQMFPLYPPIPQNTSVETRRALWRNFVGIAWVFHGGSDKVPWGIIALNVESWIPAECTPEDAVWCDPGSMNRKSLLGWERMVQRCQEENRPFWFRRIITGPAPIDPSRSEEARRETVERNGKSECHLIFERPVTRSHATGDLPYTAENYSYTAYYTASQVQSAPKPDHWHGLPTLGPDTSKPIFHPDEQKTIRNLALKCPNDVGRRIEKALDSLDEHEKHMPSSTSNGLWAFSSQLPSIFPHSPTTQLTSNSFNPIHPPLTYLTRSNAPYENTFPHFLGFIETALLGDLLRHRESNTLLGGPTGVVHVVRALLILLFCVLAIRGDLELPNVIPPGYDNSMLPFKVYGRVLEWLDTTIEFLEASTEILRKTSQERASQQYAALMAAPLFVLDESTEPTPDPGAGTSRATPVAGRAASPSLLPKRKRRSRASRSSKGKRKRDEDEESEAEESGAGSDDNDIDIMLLEQGNSDASTEAGSTYGGKDVPGIDEYAAGADKDGDFAMKSPCAASPESEDDPEPHWNTQSEETSSREYPLAFGDLEPLPDFYPPSYTTANEVTTVLQKVIKSAIERLQEFHSMGHSHEVVSTSDQSAAAVFAAAHPPALRPARELFFLRRVIWKQTQTLATMAKTYIRLFLVDLRDLMAACARGEKIARKEGLNVSKPVDTLLAQIHKAKQTSARLQFAFHELSAYHRLATEWFHAVDPAWCATPPPRGDKDMLAFARLHILWVDKTAELTTDIPTERLDVLDTLRIPHGDPVLDEPIVWFTFGCPSRIEEPLGLRDLFKAPKRAPQKHAAVVSLPDTSKDIPTLGSQVDGTAKLTPANQSIPVLPSAPSLPMSIASVVPSTSTTSSTPATPSAPAAPPASTTPEIPEIPAGQPTLPSPPPPNQVASPPAETHMQREVGQGSPGATPQTSPPSDPGASDPNAMDVDPVSSTPTVGGKKTSNRNKSVSISLPQPRRVSARHQTVGVGTASTNKTRAQLAADKTARRGKPNSVRGRAKR
ncbi:DNA ligase 4 [Ceratobasidium sp. AG-Ba]|nr:DNA ligase 4 [Ceratobasidium sp. AG-Ba]